MPSASLAVAASARSRPVPMNVSAAGAVRVTVGVRFSGTIVSGTTAEEATWPPVVTTRAIRPCAPWGRSLRVST